MTIANAQEQFTFEITDDFLLTHGKNVFQHSGTLRQSKIEGRWMKSNDLYNAQFSASERKFSDVLGIPRLFIPKTYAQVDRIHSEAMETYFFDIEEIAQITAGNKNIPTVAVKSVKAMINYRLNSHPINFYQEVHDAVQDGLIRKLGIFKVWPELKYADEKVMAGTDEKDVEKRISSYCPNLECLPYEDVFFDTRATWKDYYKFTIVHRTRRTVDYCRRRGYQNLDKIVATDAQTDLIKQQREQSQFSPFGANSMLPKAQQDIFVFEFWDLLPGEDGFLVSGSYVMLGSSALDPSIIGRGWKVNNLPYKFDEDYVRPPIVVGTPFPESHQMYGKDWPEITEGLQKETNSQRNQEREAVARALRAPLLVDKNAGLDMMALTVRKIGGIVVGEDVSSDAVRELGQSNPLALTQASQQRTDNDYAELSSIPPQSLGIQRGQANSATEFAGLDRNSNKKMAKVVRNMAITLLIPAIRMLVRLEQRYGSDELIEFVTGNKLGYSWKKERDPEGVLQYVGSRPLFMIQGEFDFTVNIGVNKQTQISQLQNLIQIGNQSNIALGQLVQLQVANPAEVKFFNPSWALEQLAPLMGQKNVKEMQLQAQPPPTPPDGGGGTSSPPSVNGTPATPEDVLAR